MVIPLTYGRMGNFLFQAATAIAYADRHGVEFTLPNTTQDAHSNPIYLQHLVNPRYKPHLPHVRLVEKSHAYQPLAFSDAWRSQNIVLDGYWQSERYFVHIRDRILALFNYPWNPLPFHVAFHVRRGDYLTLTRKHPPVTVDWMERAMKKFPNYQFVFFSDDISWCKATFGHRGDCSFSKGCSPEQDLIRMSWCEHQICSASTFSWWGAWLNRNPTKRVLFPAWWFTPGYQGLDTRDIVPAHWERMT